MRLTGILAVVSLVIVVVMLPWILGGYSPFKTPLEKLTFALVILTAVYATSTYRLARVANLQRQHALEKEQESRKLESATAKKRQKSILVDILEELKHNLAIWWSPFDEKTASTTPFMMEMWQMYKGEKLAFLDETIRDKVARVYHKMSAVNSYVTKWQMSQPETSDRVWHYVIACKNFEDELKRTIAALEDFISNNY